LSGVTNSGADGIRITGGDGIAGGTTTGGTVTAVGTLTNTGGVIGISMAQPENRLHNGLHDCKCNWYYNRQCRCYPKYFIWNCWRRIG
jgi:hypothetical protein